MVKFFKVEKAPLVSPWETRGAFSKKKKVQKGSLRSGCGGGNFFQVRKAPLVSPTMGNERSLFDFEKKSSLPIPR